MVRDLFKLGGAEAPKPKIPPKRIPSDDCEVWVGAVYRDNERVGGTAYYPHVNEWIEVIPVETMGMYLGQAQMRDPDTEGEGMASSAQALSQYILDWNWTDVMGRPLDKPYGNPKVFMQLTSEEFAYLLITMRSGGVTETEIKNADAPSADIS